MPELFDGLIRPSASLRLYKQTVGRDPAGGWLTTWVQFADAVPALVSQVGGVRDDRDGRPRLVLSGVARFAPLTGVTAADLLRLDFLSCAVPGLAGLTAEAVTVTPHAGGELVPASVVVRWEVVSTGAAG